MNAEWVGREESIIPHMPPRRVPRIIGMIEDGDADISHRLAVIVAPIRRWPKPLRRTRRWRDNMSGSQLVFKLRRIVSAMRTAMVPSLLSRK